MPRAADTAPRPRVLRDLDYSPTLMRDLPNSERPRERLRDAGPAALSNAELLAILLRTGTPSESVLDLSSRLLAQLSGLEGLARASHAELCAFHGFGEAKAAHLLAALEIGKRVAASRGEGKPTIHTPDDVARLVTADMAHLDQEHFRVLVLNTKNHVLAAPDVFVGSVKSTTIRTAEVFREAVRQNAPGVIAVHNHPSGDPQPSAEDIAVTKELIAAAATLDIEFVDHVIIGRAGFVSLKERGVL